MSGGEIYKRGDRDRLLIIDDNPVSRLLSVYIDDGMTCRALDIDIPYSDIEKLCAEITAVRDRIRDRG